ncbi:hypothetical protein DAEQUDRAFT_429004 [Daedalea quercina L-15889]|uniref:Uncharacterized protein n=1 Tax=Daedalea quercina L-15889 TaxID=1314783 RepID=A0A165NJL0_9APHY|nr:hypothetical protein DAEQUDRAFT_429004 [Daedalea quercina L-15889]
MTATLSCASVISRAVHCYDFRPQYERTSVAYPCLVGLFLKANSACNGSPCDHDSSCPSQNIVRVPHRFFLSAQGWSAETSGSIYQDLDG